MLFRSYINLYVHSITFIDDKANSCDSFVDRDMFMRYFSGGIGHHGSRRQDTTIVVDDEELDPEWVNTSGDAAVIAPQVHRPEDLLVLVPEIVNGGVREAIVQEQAAQQGGREADGEDLDGEREDGLEDEDDDYGRGAIIGSGDQDSGAHDEYSIQGYAPP